MIVLDAGKGGDQAGTAAKATYDFVASMTGSLVWPLLLVVVILLFRQPITALIPRIKSIKGPGGIEIGVEGLPTAEKDSKQILSQLSAVTAGGNRNGLDRLRYWPGAGEPPQRNWNRIDPALSITTDRRRLERSVHEFTRWTQPGRPAASFIGEVDMIQNNPYVPAGFAETVTRLVDIGEDVWHGVATATRADAAVYGNAVDDLIESLSKIPIDPAS